MSGQHMERWLDTCPQVWILVLHLDGWPDRFRHQLISGEGIGSKRGGDGGSFNGAQIWY
jgi:hypothetical protein